MVDFVHHRCAPGTLLHVSPGQVQRLPQAAAGHPEDFQAVMVRFTAAFPPRLQRTDPLLNHPFGPVARTIPQAERESMARAMAELAQEYRRAVDEADAADITIDLLRQLLSALLLRITRLPAPETADRSDTGGDIFPCFQRELE
ncbi:hypothetical protein [Streptomyces sp. NPDC101165]|uniref:hypothetical protein n=1 Tax=Streptomyces sp. NPDC101165 TaxID=3366119 RepID=UPI0037FDD735